MKEWKIQVIEKLEANAKELHSVMLRKAALECGFNHIKNNDVTDIINRFVKRNPTYKVYRLVDDFKDNSSLFCTVFFSDNESPAYEDDQWIKVNAKAVKATPAK